MNRQRERLLEARNIQLQQAFVQPARLVLDAQLALGQPAQQPGTAFRLQGGQARQKVTCSMLSETEKQLLRAPSRQRWMLNAGEASGPRNLQSQPRSRSHQHILRSASCQKDDSPPQPQPRLSSRARSPRWPRPGRRSAFG